MRNVFNYFSEVKGELKKVTWPKKEEVTRLTLLVFVISGIVAGYLGLLDFAFTNMLKFLVAR